MAGSFVFSAPWPGTEVAGPFVFFCALAWGGGGRFLFLVLRLGLGRGWAGGRVFRVCALAWGGGGRSGRVGGRVCVCVCVFFFGAPWPGTGAGGRSCVCFFLCALAWDGGGRSFFFFCALAWDGGGRAVVCYVFAPWLGTCYVFAPWLGTGVGGRFFFWGALAWDGGGRFFFFGALAWDGGGRAVVCSALAPWLVIFCCLFVPWPRLWSQEELPVDADMVAALASELTQAFSSPMEKAAWFSDCGETLLQASSAMLALRRFVGPEEPTHYLEVLAITSQVLEFVSCDGIVEMFTCARTNGPVSIRQQVLLAWGPSWRVRAQRAECALGEAVRLLHVRADFWQQFQGLRSLFRSWCSVAEDVHLLLVGLLSEPRGSGL